MQNEMIEKICPHDNTPCFKDCPYFKACEIVPTGKILTVDERLEEAIHLKFQEKLEDELKPLQQEIEELRQRLERAERLREFTRQDLAKAWVEIGWYREALNLARIDSSIRSVKRLAAENALREINRRTTIALKPLPECYGAIALQLVDAVIESVGDDDYIDYQTGQIPQLVNKLNAMRKEAPCEEPFIRTGSID